jgi:hypothetical protein
MIELQLEDAVTHSNRSAAHLNLKQHQEALADACRALELDASFVKAYGRKAAALLGLKR